MRGLSESCCDGIIGGIHTNVDVRTTPGGIMNRTLSCRWAAPVLIRFVLFIALGTLAASAQTGPTVNSRITSPIDEGALVKLSGNTLPAVQAGFDRGPAPESMPAERLMLILKRSPQQEADLQSYLQAIQDPSSPEFHRFLSPDEFGQRYGVSDSDLAKLQGWLQSHGFSINHVNRGRTAIEFSGTVGQIQEAFHTSIHRFLMDGTEHWANTSEPLVPAALAGTVAGVSSLNDFKPQPHNIPGPAGKWNSAQHRFTPEITVTSNGNHYLFVGPGDAATIYDSPNSFNSHFVSGETAYDGTGVTIGIAGTTPLTDPGPHFYRILFGMTDTHLTILYDGNQANLDPNANETEAILDTEISGGVAPGANVVYYGAGDTEFQSGLFLAIYRAIDDNKVDILSVSYGACEAALGASGNAQVLNAWEQAAAQGITVTVSTGDSGSAGCDNPNTETAATKGLAVNALASTPYNVAVGGTDFDILAKSFSGYVSLSNAANFTSALGYIPENPWNNSTASNGLLAANSALRNSTGGTNIVAGGGGPSSAANGGLAGYAKPLWQQHFAPSNTDAVRDIPDVSLLAANGQYGAVWAICEGGNDCTGGSGSTIHGVGGTSASAPAFAGMLAAIMQKAGGSARLGQVNATLYALAQTNPAVFHAVVTGNNSVYCTSGSPGCGTNGFLMGYNAGPSYNMATGLGSVDLTVLANNWANYSLTPTSTSLNLDKTSFAHGTSVNFTAGVTPTAATGDVAITSNYTSQAQAMGSVPTFRLSLTGGSASGSFSQLPGGTYNVYANYGGDINHAGSISPPVQVTVSPENSTVQFSAAMINSNYTVTNIAGKTIPLGSFISLNAEPIGASQAANPTPATNATGTILFGDSYSGSGLATGFNQVALDSTGNVEVNTSAFNAGTHTISASYSGDLSYNASSASPISFTVAKASSTVTVTPSATSIISGSLELSAAVVTSFPYGTPGGNGTFTFTDTTSNTVLGTTFASDYYGCTSVNSLLCFGGVLTVNVTQLAPGNNNLVATYSGDANFLSSAQSAPAVVNCIAGCGNATGQTISLSFGQESPATISAGGSVTAVVSVNPGGGFTGAVNLTCSISGQSSSDQKIPTCSFNPSQVSVASSNQAVNSTITINTTAATSSALNDPAGNPAPGQLRAAGGAVLAAILVFGISPRRFRLRLFTALLAIFIAVGCMTACGGGGGSSSGGGGGSGTGGGGGGGTTVSGTTADVYTVTFRAVDAATGTVTAQDYFKFTVN